MKDYRSTLHQAGFTLIELSIVLTIIGLIVGGILVGQDLINAALIRGTVSQLQKYETAVQAFNSKYNCLPGDCAKATQFGFTSAQGSGGYAAANTLGDGLINSCQNDTATTATYPPYGYVAFGCENAMFWNHLSQAQLISENFTQISDANSFQNITTQFAQYLPTAKLGNNNYILVDAWNGTNYFYITGIAGELSNSNGSIFAWNYLTPLQAYQIDMKIDDGSPISGAVQANDYSQYSLINGNFRLNLSAGSASACRNAANLYNTTNSSNLCQLQVNAGF